MGGREQGGNTVNPERHFHLLWGILTKELLNILWQRSTVVDFVQDSRLFVYTMINIDFSTHCYSLCNVLKVTFFFLNTLLEWNNLLWSLLLHGRTPRIQHLGQLVERALDVSTGSPWELVFPVPFIYYTVAAEWLRGGYLSPIYWSQEEELEDPHRERFRGPTHSTLVFWGPSQMWTPCC